MDERDDVREQIYKKICESTILQYKSDTLDIEAMELDTELAEKMIKFKIMKIDKKIYEMLKSGN